MNLQQLYLPWVSLAALHAKCDCGEINVTVGDGVTSSGHTSHYEHGHRRIRDDLMASQKRKEM